MRFFIVLFLMMLSFALCAKTKQAVKPTAQAKTQTKKSTPKLPINATSKKVKPNQVPAGYKEVKFELPRPLYVSLQGSRLQTTALPHQPRGKVYLPADARNVALHKPVTSSDDFPIIGKISQITDGDKELTEVHLVEIGPGTQWVQIDLKEKFKIHGVLLWHSVASYGTRRVYRDVVIHLANDVEFTKNVRTVYNNDDDNSSGFGVGKDREYYEDTEGQWISFEAEPARYVRLYSRGNTSDPQNQYSEVEVWASPVKKKEDRK